MIGSNRIAERTQYFTGRRWVFQQIHDWLAAPADSRYFLITGEPGSGKTALAGRLYQFSAGEHSPNGYSQLGANSIAAAHFCSAGDATSVDPRIFARSIALQLSSREQAYAQALKDIGDKTININVENNIGVLEANSQAVGVVIHNLDVSRLSAQDAFNRVVIDPLLAIYNEDFTTPLTILVDSLDEALTHAGDINIVKLLSNLESLSPHVRFILTSRHDDRVESRFTTADGVILSAAEFGVHNREDILSYVTERLAADPQLSARLLPGDPSFPETIADKADGNFQYAAFVLSAIAQGQLPQVNAGGLPPGLDALYYQSLARVVDLGKRDWTNDYAPTMGVLSVAEESATIGQLRNLTGQPESTVWASVTDLQQFVEDLQPGDAEDEIRYSFYHRSVTEFLRRRQIKLEKKSLSNRFYVPPAEWHRKAADFYLGKPASAWDEYGLKYVPTHLAEAARASEGKERHGHVEALVKLTVDSQFRSEHSTRLHDLVLLQRDLQQSAQAAAENDDPAGLPLVVESALAVVDFRRKELRPEPLFELALSGKVDEAARRLELFDVEFEWQQIALVTIAWMATPANVTAAKALRDRVAGMPRVSPRVARLIQFFDAAIGTRPSPPREVLPAPKPFEVVQALVDRMGGSGNGSATELLVAHGIPPVRNPSMRADAGHYLSQHDAPILVSFAVAGGAQGEQLLRQYIGIHTNYHYLVYRTRSLCYLLDAILNHPADQWIRRMAVELACSALAGSRVDFQEALPFAVRAVRASLDVQAVRALEIARDQHLQIAASILPGRQSDPMSTTRRRLAALAEAFRLINRPADSALLIDAALKLPYGFAGFNAAACLTLAEAIEISQPQIVNALQRALDSALQSAHNVQDNLYCARMTARVNAMRLVWWDQPFDAAARIERFCADPEAAEFCPLHLAGEDFSHRSEQGMELPSDLLNARTLHEIAAAFRRPASELERANPNLPADQRLDRGTPVRIPDPGFATWLAARFAGAALAQTGLLPQQRVALVRSLAPIATPNPTALDTVLARLIMAARPASAGILDRVEEIANKSILPQTALEAALPG